MNSRCREEAYRRDALKGVRITHFVNSDANYGVPAVMSVHGGR